MYFDCDILLSFVNAFPLRPNIPPKMTFSDDARFDFRRDTCGVDMSDWRKCREAADKNRSPAAKQVLNDGPGFFCCIRNCMSCAEDMHRHQRRMDCADLLTPCP